MFGILRMFGLEYYVSLHRLDHIGSKVKCRKY